ncbi:MAG: 30S ribosome-binding factor RbfA [Bacteroidia bacterium]|nr:30S ribosome-binding factor RbfA [Bacteroidia bacterium]
MESKKQKQVGELIKRNFGIILQQEGSYIYGTQALVTVTSVKMSPDLGIAKIYVSVYNSLNKQEAVIELNEHLVRLRQSLANRIKKHVRRIPQIQIYLDDMLDEMYRLNDIFDKLEDDNQLG